MQRTVLIIAHNEATHISECLESLEKQTITPDEIILVAHNCTDETVVIAKKFPNIQIEELYTEEKGPIFPRIRGFELAKHEIIACIDGDSVAESDWLEKITKPLQKEGIVGVGGNVGFKKDITGDISAWGFFRFWKYFSHFHFYFWGANFACKKFVYNLHGGLSPFIELRKKLGLYYWAEDCYLSLALEQYGSVVYEENAKVVVYPKSTNPFSGLYRGKKQNDDRKKLFRFFGI